MYPRSVPYENVLPERDNIVTVCMPGLTSTRSQLARYTGGEPVTVLHNWADCPADPLHEVDKNKNRFSGMPALTRLRRTWWLLRAVLLGGHDSVVCEDEAVRGLPCDAVLEAGEPLSRRRHGPTTRSRRSSSSGGGDAASFTPAGGDEVAAAEVTIPRSLREADLGLVDPPVLYRAACRVAPRILHGVLASPEVSEVRHRRWYATLNPVHWLMTLKEVATGWWFCTRPIQLCYSEPGRTNMGGLRDQAVYHREVRRALHKLASEEQAAGGATPRRRHLVLFGVSRGATTCFYSAMKLPAQEARRVSLVIVEAPFDTLQHVVEASSYCPGLLRWFFRSFCDWRGAADEAAAYDFDPLAVHLRCPIAFILSAKDRRVPNECTQALIDRVRRELVPNVVPAVEVLTLQHSRHPCMAVGHKDDQDAYVAFVEDLYTRYCPP